MDLLQDKDFQQNIMKFATMLVVSKSFSTTDSEWQTASLYVLIGFATYHAVTKKLVNNEFEGPMKAVVNTWLKVGTMLAVSRALGGKPFDTEFYMESAYTLAGFNVYDVLVYKYVPVMENPILAQITADAMVVGTMATVKQALMGKPHDRTFVIQTLQTIAGFAAYNVLAGLN
jgi:hypothetical protein